MGAPSPLGSKMTSWSRSSGIQSRACNTKTGDGVPGEVQSQPEEGSLGRLCRTQKTSQDLGLALGLRSAGHWGCLLLFAECIVCQQGVFRNVSQEHVQMSPLDSETQVQEKGTLGSRTKSLGIPHPLQALGGAGGQMTQGVGKPAHPSYTQYNYR